MDPFQKYGPAIHGFLGERAETFWPILIAIHEDLDSALASSELGNYPFDTCVGGVLLNRYLYEIRPEPRFDASADRFLDSLLANIDEYRLWPLYGGTTGVGWLMAHLANLAGEEAGVGDLDDELHRILAEPWPGSLDLLYGLAGIGFYALERYPDEAGCDLLDRVVGMLADFAKRTGDAIFWQTYAGLPPIANRGAPDRGSIDLGMAHGCAAIIRLLAECVQRGIRQETARALLEGSVPWFITQVKSTGQGSCLPGYADTRIAPRRRLAWCYNELGAMPAVLAAGRVCRRSEWFDQAIAVLQSTLGTELLDSGCKGPALCHGSAGIAHLYQCIAAESGLPEFQRESTLWFERTLDYRRPGSGSGGFLQPVNEGAGDEASLNANHSFLAGASGIGLALIAAAWNVDAGWNRLLGLR